ncbi:MAG: MarR family transcriptional regulator [Candidatus Omnitrophica bacterium]|nr:MarR family transcriptional regulator [Candidatus Omnitrophota bacterium]
MQYTLVELVEIITKLIDDLEAEFTKKYQEEGFTTRQIVYIDTINMLGNPNLGEIAKALKLSKPSVTAIVDKLASKGYIEKFQSDEDRRSFHVHLSAKGKNLVKMHALTHNKIVDMLQDNLDGRDLKNLVTILNKVVSKV